MPTLSRDQIAMYARSAGLSADRAHVAAAVAMAESSGRAGVHNFNPATGDDSWGLWQINMTAAAGGPARRRALGLSSDSQLADPGINARAMAMISHNGQDFTPWSTYRSGAYKAFMGGAVDASASQAFDIPGIPDLTGGLGSGLEGLKSLADLGIGAGEWMADPHNWIRVTQVVVGGALVLVGLQLMIETKVLGPVGKALSSGADYVPQGRALKTAGKARKAKVAAQADARRAPAKNTTAPPAKKTTAPARSAS